MNRSNLISHVAEHACVDRATADRTVSAMVTAIADVLARGEDVAIAGYGKFTVRHRPARRERNPRTGEPVAIAASKAPAFKAAGKLRETVNRLR